MIADIIVSTSMILFAIYFAYLLIKAYKDVCRIDEEEEYYSQMIILEEKQ